MRDRGASLPRPSPCRVRPASLSAVQPVHRAGIWACVPEPHRLCIARTPPPLHAAERDRTPPPPISPHWTAAKLGCSQQRVRGRRSCRPGPVRRRQAAPCATRCCGGDTASTRHRRRRAWRPAAATVCPGRHVHRPGPPREVAERVSDCWPGCGQVPTAGLGVKIVYKNPTVAELRHGAPSLPSSLIPQNYSLITSSPIVTTHSQLKLHCLITRTRRGPAASASAPACAPTAHRAADHAPRRRIDAGLRARAAAPLSACACGRRSLSGRQPSPGPLRPHRHASERRSLSGREPLPAAPTRPKTTGQARVCRLPSRTHTWPLGSVLDGTSCPLDGRLA